MKYILNVSIDYSKNYILKTNSIIGKSNPRNSKTPFTKWYIKGYSEYYKFLKIINALIKENCEGLNDNIKSELKNFKLNIFSKEINN